MIVREVRARRSNSRRRRRRGVTAVETAFVLTLVVSFVFGIFEYCRLLMDMSVLNNAAREGVRYAQVHNTDSTVGADVSAVVTGFMAGRTSSYSGFTVAVSGTHSGVSTAVNNLTAGDQLTVTVSGTYSFMNIIPVIRMPASLPLSSSVTVGCEGGT